MNSSDAAHALIKQHALTPEAAKRMLTLASPPLTALEWETHFWRTVMLLAGALIGFGVVFWVAANWDNFGRQEKFVFLLTTLAVMGVGAALRLKPNANQNAATGLAFLTFMLVGSVFAYFGQTYQMGADPWQLFALWAGLTLPLCLAFRSDVLWTFWVLVSALAIKLCLHAYQLRGWSSKDMLDYTPTLLAWFAGVVLAASMSRPMRRFTGAGPWSFRSAVILFVLLLTGTAIISLLAERFNAIIVLALAIAAFGAWHFSTRTHFDILLLSAFSLSGMTLAYSLFVRALVHLNQFKFAIGSLLLLSIIAAVLLALVVGWILHVQRLQRGHRYEHTPQRLTF